MRQKEIVYNDAGCRFEKYNGQASEVQLQSGQDMLLTVIGVKAFLSCKTIEKLILPDSLERVEDWGFAHMKNLREITLPAGKIDFGKKVFLGCDRLQKVRLIPHKQVNSTCGNTQSSDGMILDMDLYEGLPYFLASMFRFFPEKVLENLKTAGDKQGQWEWLARYDEALQTYIQRPDDYDFEPAFIGWFDIEDVDDQKQHYILQQRKHKIRLSFQRLLYDERLSTQSRQCYQEYIRKEAALTEEMFLDAEEECSRDICFFRVWERIGGLDRDCAGRLLEKIAGDKPEIRGYLLNLQLSSVDKGDYFAGLDL